MREFNTALLGKWCWRLLVYRGGLWYRVLVARYGEEAGRLAVGDRMVLCGGGGCKNLRWRSCRWMRMV
jgi:hypothetical protein